MKHQKRNFVYVLIFIGLILPNLIFGQDEDKAWDYYNNEQYSLAAQEFIKVKEKINEINIKNAELCLFIASSYELSKNYEQAIFYYNLCIGTYQSIPDGEKEEYYGICVNNLAKLYQSMGQYEIAKTLYIKLIEVDSIDNSKKSINYKGYLTNLGKLYELMKQYENAILVYEEILKYIEKDSGKNNYEYAAGLNNLALLYKTVGKYEKALLLYEEALKTFEIDTEEGHSAYNNCFYNIGKLYYYTGQYEKAIPIFIENLEITKKTFGKENSAYMIRLRNLSGIYKRTGQYEKALIMNQEALEIVEQTFGKNNHVYDSILNAAAILYYNLGQYENALSLYQETLNYTEESLGKDDPEYSVRLNNLAELYRTLGLYDKALPLYLEAINSSEKIKGENYYYFLNNIATLYKDIGQYEKALILYQDALDNIKITIGSERPEYGKLLRNLASLYSEMNLYEEALPIFLESIDNAEKTLGKEHPDYGTSIHNLGLLYYEMGLYEDALPMYKESLSITVNTFGRESPDYVTQISNLALLYWSLGRCEEAINLLEEAIISSKKTLGIEHPKYSNRLNNLALLYTDLNQLEKALPLFVEGIKVINHNIRQNFDFLSEAEKEEYLGAVSLPFDGFNSFVLQYKSNSNDITNLVYDNTLTNKGILLKSSTAMRAAVLSSGDTNLIQQFDEWTVLNRQIARLYSTEKSKREQDPQQLEEKANLIERQLVQESKEFSDFNRLQEIEWKEVRDKLKPGEAAIEFISFDYYDQRWTDSTYYCALVLREEYETPQMVFLFEERQVAEAILFSADRNPAQLVASLYGLTRGATVLNHEEVGGYGDALYHLIWQPMDSLLEGIDKVYYSPSGLLHNISFAAIPTSDSTLLCDRYDLSLVSTTANIVLKEEPVLENMEAAIYGGITYDVTREEMFGSTEKYQGQTKDLLAYHRGITYPDTLRGGSWGTLNGTLIEAGYISTLLKNSHITIKSYTGADANEESFKALSGRNSPGIIHLATHGFFFPDPKKEKRNDFALQQLGGTTFSIADNPLLRSGLILAGGNAAWNREEIPDEIEDGILTAYEVSGLDLFHTQLVTLSACETGLGDIQGTEGVYGLQRAFKMAGVDYLIMSLWQVPDKETMEFMDGFYSNWMGGQTIGDAFRNTQRIMRKKYDAYYWAGFVLLE